MMHLDDVVHGRCGGSHGLRALPRPGPVEARCTALAWRACFARLTGQHRAAAGAGLAGGGARAGLEGPEGLGGGEAGGAEGGQQAGGGADEQGGGQAAGPGGGGDDGGPVLGGGVDGGGGGAGGHPHRAAGQGEQDGLGQELGADVAPGGAQRAAQPDFGAAFEDGDDHDVGHADGADQQRDRAEAEEQAVEGGFGVGLGGQGGGGLGDGDLGGVFGVGGGRQQRLDGGDLVGLGAQVDGGGVPVEVQVALRGGEPDQHGGVNLRGQDGGAQDAGQVEPLAADPDPLAGPDAADAEALGGGGAEHRDRFAGGGGVEVVADGDAGADGGGQAEA